MREHLPFRKDIEGLRAVAVLLVVAFHAGVRALSGGFVGVDVFFVISGYLITALLTNEIERTGRISLPTFFARRMRRLIPVAAVVLLATLVTAAIVYPPLEIIRTAASTQAAAAYVANVHYLRLASDYFSGDAASSPVVHTWSLSVEEQFYLVWPLVFVVLASANLFSRRRLAWTLTAISVVSFVAASFYVTANHSLAFYAMPPRAWEFALGGVLSLIAWRTTDAEATIAPWCVALGWVGLVAVVWSAVSYSAATEFPGVSALVPVIGTAMVLVAGALQAATSRWSVGALLGASPLQWIGRRSYGWYLWHWPVIVLGTSFVPNASVALRVTLSGASLALAALTYRFVETPLRAGQANAGAGERQSWRTIRLGFAAALVVVAAAQIAGVAATVASHSPAQRAFTAAAKDIADPYHTGCVNEQDDAQVHVCRYGASQPRMTLALFGDSHAAQWFPALERIAQQHQWSLLLVAKTRCATADVPVYLPGTRTESVACRRWRSAAMDTLRRRHPNIVILANAIVYVHGPGLSPDAPAVSVDAWSTGMISTLSAFRSSNIPTVIIQGTPLLSANAPFCLARSGWLGRRTNSCATDRARAINADIVEVERHAVSSIAGAHIIDLTDALCSPTMCAPIVDGVVAYSDNEHLTASMARSLAAKLDSALGNLRLATVAENAGDR